MTILTVVANDLAVADPATPPAGWTQIANALRVATGTPKYFLGTNSANCIWINDTLLPGAVFYARIVLDVFGSDSQGVAICNASGVGYEFLVNSSVGARLFAMTTGGILSGQKGSTVATSATAGEVVEVEFRVGDPSAGNVRLICKVNGVERINFTEANANTNWYGGAVVRGSGRARSISVEYTAAQTLDTLTDPLVAGAAFSGTSTGFTDGAATLSSNGLSVAVTVASGAFSGTWPIAVDAQSYPTLPKSAQTITLAQGANTATIASDLEQPAVDDIVNFVSPITGDDTYPTYYIEQDGFTADGGQFVFTPYSDLVIAADGEITVTGAGVLVGYFIPATGTGAGNAYYYTFNVIDGAVVSGGRSLSVRGLSVVGASVTGLSVRGL